MTSRDVQGHCPACGWTTLFLADGGYITCSRVDCSQSDAASTLLERDPRATGYDAVRDVLTAMDGTTGARFWAGQLRTALHSQQPQPDEGAAPGLPLSWCGASMPTGIGAEPIGPCVLRHSHNGPIHQAANGARWWTTAESDRKTDEPTEAAS